MEYISNLIRGKEKNLQRYEERFSDLDKIIGSYDGPIDKDSLSTDIAYLMYKSRYGGLGRAIRAGHRKITKDDVDNTVKGLQDLRGENAYHKKGLSKDIEEIVKCAEGRRHYMIRDRLDYISNNLETKNEYSNEDIDNLRYVGMIYEKNSYLKKKERTDKKLRDKKKKVLRKIENIIHYHDSEKKKGTISRRRNMTGLFKYAAASIAVAFMLTFNPLKDEHKKDISLSLLEKKEIVLEKTPLLKIPDNYHAIVNKAEQKMYVMNNDSILRTYTVSTGVNPGDKERRGDHKTPEGDFRIIQKQKSSHWTYLGKKAYGPFFLRLDTRWGDIGIHGTDHPELLGSRASRGCIRMGNDDLLDLINNFSDKKMLVSIRK